MSIAPFQPSNTLVLSSAARTPLVQILPSAESWSYDKPPFFRMYPGIIVTLSAGASLTYSVQVTGDDFSQWNYNSDNGNWVNFPNLSGLTASATGTLLGAATGISCIITSYTSGSLTFQVVLW